jgi:hypothetical protein
MLIAIISCFDYFIYAFLLELVIFGYFPNSDIGTGIVREFLFRFYGRHHGVNVKDQSTTNHWAVYMYSGGRGE